MPEIFSTYSPEIAAVSLPTWVDLASVVVGSAGGVMVARARHLDAVGFVGLALLCGLGGGLIRDVMMQVGRIYMLTSPFAIPVSVATGLVAFLFPQPLDRASNLLEWLDIMAVALFALVGTDKAIVHGFYPASCVLMGIMTGVGGGMLRDVFLGEVPRIFQKSNLYAVCALAWCTTSPSCAARSTSSGGRFSASRSPLASGAGRFTSTCRLRRTSTLGRTWRHP